MKILEGFQKGVNLGGWLSQGSKEKIYLLWVWWIFPYNSNIDYIGYKDSKFEDGYKSFIKSRLLLSN